MSVVLFCSFSRRTFSFRLLRFFFVLRASPFFRLIFLVFFVSLVFLVFFLVIFFTCVCPFSFFRLRHFWGQAFLSLELDYTLHVYFSLTHGLTFFIFSLQHFGHFFSHGRTTWSYFFKVSFISRSTLSLRSCFFFRFPFLRPCRPPFFGTCTFVIFVAIFFSFFVDVFFRCLR